MTNTIQRLQQRATFTPDFRDIRETTNIPVFVYGTLKSDLSNHGLLKGAVKVGDAYLSERAAYHMVSAGGFPVLYYREYNKKLGIATSYSVPRIDGEVYSVTPEHMLALDALESNGYMYQRELKNVCLALKPNSFRTQKVWIYLGLRDAFNYESMPHVETIRHRNQNIIDWYPNTMTQARQRQKKDLTL